MKNNSLMLETVIFAFVIGDRLTEVTVTEGNKVMLINVMDHLLHIIGYRVEVGSNVIGRRRRYRTSLEAL